MQLKRIYDGTWLEIFVNLGVKRTGWVLAFGALALGFGVWGMRHLGVDQDLKALLPPDYESVRRLERLSELMGGQSDLVVSIESPSRQANIAFGEALSAKMRADKDLKYVQFKRDLDFFKNNALLFMPMADLLETRQKVIDRIKRETEKQVVEDLDEGDPTVAKAPPAPAEEDPFDLDEDELVRKYLGGGQVPSEYMEADEGRIIVIKSRPILPTTDVEFTTKLVDEVEAQIKAMNPAQFHPELKATLVGEYKTRVSQASGMRSDVLSSVLFIVGILVVTTIAWFRRLRAVHILFLPVVISTIVTFGMGGLYYGKFNLVTTFIFAVLLGLGEDFATYCMARYFYERDRGVSVEESLRIALVSTGNPTAIGAATTVASFFLLALGDFQGFAQFGIVGGTGVLLTIFLTFLLLPPLLVVTEKLSPWKPRKSVAQLEPPPVKAPSKRGLGFAAAIIAVSFGLAGLGFFHAGEITFEYNFKKLGAPPKPEPKQTGPAKPDVDDAMGRETTYAPAVAFCDTLDDSRQAALLLGAVKRASSTDLARLRGDAVPPPVATPAADAAGADAVGGDSAAEDDDDDPFAKKPKADPFASLKAELGDSKLLPEERKALERLGTDGKQAAARADEMRYFLQAFLSLHSFVPERQEDKLRIIKDIKERIDAKRAALTEETRGKLDKYGKYLEVNHSISVADVPDWLTQQLRDNEGGVGRFVIMWNRGSKADYTDAKRLHEAFFDLPIAGKSVPVAANYFIMVETMETMWHDSPIVFWAATAATALLILLLFRSLWATFTTILIVAVAIGWVAVYYWLVGLKLNMFSVVAVPLLFGMGSDYPIQFFGRWREEGNITVPLRETGGTLFFAAFTTAVGFIALLFADHIGIQTLGITAFLGVSGCFVGTVATLPAILYVVDYMRARKAPTS